MSSSTTLKQTPISDWMAMAYWDDVLPASASDTINFGNHNTVPLSPLELGSPLDDYFPLEDGFPTSLLHTLSKRPSTCDTSTHIDQTVSDPLTHVLNTDHAQPWWTDPLLFPSTSALLDPILSDIPRANEVRSPSLFSRDPTSPNVSEVENEYAKASSPESTTLQPLQREKRPSRYPASRPGAARKGANKRIPHSEVEKKYRESLNANLERLRKALASRSGSGGNECDGDVGDDSEELPKLSKAAVLAGAVDYIRQLERKQTGLNDENTRLRKEAVKYRRALDILQRRILLAGRVRTKDCTECTNTV